jgi:hypothetical protein
VRRLSDAVRNWRFATNGGKEETEEHNKTAIVSYEHNVVRLSRK